MEKGAKGYDLDLEKTEGLHVKGVILIYFFQVHRFCPNCASTTLSQPVIRGPCILPEFLHTQTI